MSLFSACHSRLHRSLSRGVEAVSAGQMFANRPDKRLVADLEREEFYCPRKKIVPCFKLDAVKIKLKVRDPSLRYWRKRGNVGGAQDTFVSLFISLFPSTQQKLCLF